VHKVILGRRPFRRPPPLPRSKGAGAGFSPIEFRKGRRRRRLIGVLLFWGALALLLLDMTTSFPTPVRGQYAMWWLIIVAAGAAVWIASKRLPLEEALEVSKYCRGELKATDLTSELHVTLDTSERILLALERKGYAKREQRGDTHVWVIPEVQAAIRQRAAGMGNN
jgi:hypothetical protein